MSVAMDARVRVARRISEGVNLRLDILEVLVEFKLLLLEGI